MSKMPKMPPMVSGMTDREQLLITRASEHVHAFLKKLHFDVKREDVQLTVENEPPSYPQDFIGRRFVKITLGPSAYPFRKQLHEALKSPCDVAVVTEGARSLRFYGELKTLRNWRFDASPFLRDLQNRGSAGERF